jgi:hypothetical protein
MLRYFNDNMRSKLEREQQTIIDMTHPAFKTLKISNPSCPLQSMAGGQNARDNNSVVMTIKIAYSHSRI